MVVPSLPVPVKVSHVVFCCYHDIHWIRSELKLRKLSDKYIISTWSMRSQSVLSNLRDVPLPQKPLVISLNLCTQRSLTDSHPIMDIDNCCQAYPTLRPFFPDSIVKDILRQPLRKIFESGTTHSALAMGRARIGSPVPD